MFPFPNVFAKFWKKKIQVYRIKTINVEFSISNRFVGSIYDNKLRKYLESMICSFFRQTATDGALLNNFESKSVGVFDPRCRNIQKQKTVKMLYEKKTFYWIWFWILENPFVVQSKHLAFHRMKYRQLLPLFLFI